MLSAGFISLTVWQVRRYGQNRSLLNQRNQAAALPAEPLQSFAAEDILRLRFRKVIFTAEIYRQAFVLTPGKSAGGLSGRHFQVFARPKDSHLWLLVNAGFASSKTTPEAYWKTIPETVQIEGTISEMYPMRDSSLVRQGNSSEFMIPEMTRAVLEKMTGLRVFPGILEVSKPLTADLEKTEPRVLIKPEMNLLYALQWFALALLTGWWLRQQLTARP